MNGELDNLTKLYTERYLYSSIDQEILRAQRYGRPMSILFLAVDVPEEHRQDMHYRVLKQLGLVVKMFTRNIDIGGRTKEGVTVMLPETPIEGALVVAKKIKEQIENYVFKNLELEKEFKIKLIYKIVAYPEHGQDRNDLLIYLNKVARECPTEFEQVSAISKQDLPKQPVSVKLSDVEKKPEPIAPPAPSALKQSTEPASKLQAEQPKNNQAASKIQKPQEKKAKNSKKKR